MYLSDGPDRSYKIGNTALTFEHTALKEPKFRLRETGLIVHALKSLGEERVTRRRSSTAFVLGCRNR